MVQHGGRRHPTASYIERIYSIFAKNTHFQGYRGADQGGPDGGPLKWGAGWEADFLYTWGADGGPIRGHISIFIAKKTRFFEWKTCSTNLKRRPPLRPPLLKFTKFQNITCDH